MSHPDLTQIEFFIFDVDGVLTDGSINISDDGSETKRFHVRDGFGFALWHKAGHKIGIITGRSGHALMHRMRSLGVDENLIIQGSRDKSQSLDQLIERTGIDPSKIGYMGDDIPDLPAIERAGFSACPCDAHAEVQAKCDLVTKAKGGYGAAREVLEHVMSAMAVMKAQ